MGNIFEAPTTISAGTYPCVVTHVGVELIETREGPKDLVRWEVELTTDDGPVTLDALSSMQFGARAKARQWATALGVTKEQVAAEDLVGREALAVVEIESRDGVDYNKLAQLVPAAKSKSK